jgi:hemerythrin
MEVVWNTRHNTGIQLIDEQHQELFRLVECLRIKLMGEAERGEIETLLEGLVASTGHHFATEETFMAQFGYPDFDAHVSEHASMLASLKGLLAEFKENHRDMIQMLPVFMEGWLKHHLSDGDFGFVSFLKSRNLA